MLINFTFYFTVISLITFGLSGNIFLKKTSRDNELVHLARNIFAHIAIFCLIIFLAAYFHMSINVMMKILVVMLIVLTSRNLFRFRFKNISLVKFILGSTFIAIWEYLPQLYGLAKQTLLFGAITLTNNDIANYALVATHFLHSGFTNSEQLAQINPNDWMYRATSQLPEYLISFFSILFHKSTIEVTILAGIFATVLLVLGIARLGQALFPKISPTRTLLMFGPIVWISIFTYINANYFLAQILGMAVLCFSIGEVVAITQNDLSNMSRLDVVRQGLFVALGIFTYPPLFVPIYGVLVLGLLVVVTLKKRELLFKFLKFQALSALVAIVLTNVYSKIAIELTINQSTAPAGWTLWPLNPLAVTVLPAAINLPLRISLWIALWGIVVGCFLFCYVRYVPRNSKSLSNSLLLSSISMPVIFYFLGHKLSEYQSWKLLTCLLPIFIIIAINAMAHYPRIGLYLVTLFYGIVLLVPINQWIPFIQAGQNVTTSQQLEVHSIVEANHLTAVNVNAGPYFDSMVLASTLDKQVVWLSAQNYFRSGSNPDLCTIFRLKDGNQLDFKKINNLYGIAASQNKKCRI